MELPRIDEFIAAVELSGLIVSKNFALPHHINYKEDGTPVTAVDAEVNQELANYAKFWKIGFLGEEGNGTVDADYHLYVDPLDGTDAYVRGMAPGTIIGSIMHDGMPIMAVIHNPVTKQTWSAVRDEGAYYSRNRMPGERIVVAKNPKLKWRTAICAWPGVDNRFAKFQKRVLESNDFSDQQMGAFGIGGGLIASGLLHATAISGPTSAVETAAMSLIVREAGGFAVDFRHEIIERFELGMHKGKPDFLLPHGAIIACNPLVADALALHY